MRDRLVGTTRVRVEDTVAERVDFDAEVSFGGSDEELSFRDRHGHPLAVDKAGHLTRVFSETDDDVRRQIIEGTARAIAHLRDEIGIDAHVQLRLPARSRPRRPDDRARLRHRPGLPQPAHPSRRHRPGVLPDGARAAQARLEGGAHVRRRPQAVPAAVRRPGRARRRLRRLPRRGGLLPAGRSQRAARARGADPRLHGHARGRAAGRAGRPGAGAGVPLRTELAGPRPGLRQRRPAGRAPSARRLAARHPHRPDRLERALPLPTQRGSEEGVRVRRLGVQPDPGRRDGRGPRQRERSRHRLVHPSGPPGHLVRLLGRRAAPDDAQGEPVRWGARRTRAAAQRPPQRAARRRRAVPRGAGHRSSTPGGWSAASTPTRAATCGGCAR